VRATIIETETQMRRRGCLIAVGAMAGLILLCCVLAWFVGIPQLRDNIADTLSEELSTQVASQLDSPAGDLPPGTYTLSVEDLQDQFEENIDESTASDVGISVNPTGIDIGFTSGTQDFGYSGMPVARDGRLAIDDMTVDEEFLGWIMPADRVAGIIEDGINEYFITRGLEIESIELGDDEITFTTVSAGN